MEGEKKAERSCKGKDHLFCLACMDENERCISYYNIFLSVHPTQHCFVYFYANGFS